MKIKLKEAIEMSYIFVMSTWLIFTIVYMKLLNLEFFYSRWVIASIGGIVLGSRFYINHKNKIVDDKVEDLGGYFLSRVKFWYYYIFKFRNISTLS